MQPNKYLLALSVAASTMTLIACGGGGSDGGSNHPSNGGGNNPEPTASLQQRAYENGQVQYTEIDPMIDGSTFAAGVAQARSVTAGVGPTDSFFDATDYIGAVDPDATTPWWSGWTASVVGGDGMLQDGDFHPLQAEIEDGTITPASSATCPVGTANGTLTVFGVPFPRCDIAAGITSDVTLTNDHIYVLTQLVNVGDGGDVDGHSVAPTLTIEAGTQILGAGDDIALVITRGADVVVNGTADAPVVMSGLDAANNDVDPADLSGRGQWGGLIIDGYARVSDADSNGNVASEAVADGTTRYFGGSDDADGSGSISYLVIAESGFAFNPDQEVQGLTLEGVGSGTVIDYLQVLGSEDDGIEWFGGTVNAKHIVVNGQDDDALDMDQGYRGNIQFALVRMGSANGDHGIESDGKDDAQPYTAPTIMNMTILGNVGKSSATTRGVLHRENFQGDIYRSIIADDTVAGGAFEGGCLDIDDVLPAELQWRDMIVHCTPAALVAADD